MGSKRVVVFLLLWPLLTGCVFTVEVKKSAPPAPVVVNEALPPKILMVCDPMTSPTLPPLPSAPSLTDQEADDATKVADALIEYVDSFNRVSAERDSLRAKAIEDHRKSCRPILDQNKTLPE